MSDSWDNLDLTPRKNIEKDIDCSKNLLSQTNLNSAAKLQICVEDNDSSVNTNAFQFVANSGNSVDYINSVNSINSINSVNSIEEEQFIDEDEVEQLLSDVYMHENNIKPNYKVEQKDEKNKFEKEKELIEKNVINNKREISDETNSKNKNYFKDTFYNVREKLANTYNTTINKIFEHKFPNKIKEMLIENKYKIIYFIMGSTIIGLNISIIYNKYKMLNDRVSNLERELCYKQYRQYDCYFYIFQK
jgi:hypothetical protein